MFVVAGPPGSGKSTYFPLAGFGVDGFNIDDRCGASPDWLIRALGGSLSG